MADRDYFFVVTDTEATEIEEPTAINEVKPAASKIVVTDSMAAFPGRLEVYNLHGQRVAAGEDMVNMAQLPRGIYVLRATAGHHTVATKVVR